MRYRVYIEETSSRVFYRDVDAESPADAESLAGDAIADDWEVAGWTETNGADAGLEVREELTETVDADGRTAPVYPAGTLRMK